MNEEKTNKDEGWLATLLPVFVTVVVSLATVMMYTKFFGPANDAPITTPDKFLVFSMGDWAKLPATATPDEMAEHFAKARMAAKKAGEKGYIVIDEHQLLAYPNSLKLMPDSPLVKSVVLDEDK